MNEKATKRGGGVVLAVVLVAVLAILPMLYVLSIGPVCWMVNNDLIDQSWMPAIENAYGPLDWTAHKIPGGHDALSMYMSLWDT